MRRSTRKELEFAEAWRANLVAEEAGEWGGVRLWRVTPTKSQGCALLKKPEARRSGEAERDLTGERGGDCGLIGRADVPCRMGQELGTRNTYAIGRREWGT